MRLVSFSAVVWEGGRAVRREGGRLSLDRLIRPSSRALDVSEHPSSMLCHQRIMVKPICMATVDGEAFSVQALDFPFPLCLLLRVSFFALVVSFIANEC
jgi:hypothetical protein